MVPKVMWEWVFSACTAGLSCSSTKDWDLKTELTQLSQFHFHLLVALSFSVSFPLWNHGNCLLQNWGLQPDSPHFFNCSNVQRLSLDLNLSQNQSHSQATQPFCIPISPCVCVRIKMPAECQWETWILFQLCLVHFRVWQIIYLHNICKVILHCFGLSYWGGYWINLINFILLHSST